VEKGRVGRKKRGGVSTKRKGWLGRRGNKRAGKWTPSVSKTSGGPACSHDGHNMIDGSYPT